jgi:NADH-quinone oxidoreductase subunit J
MTVGCATAAGIVFAASVFTVQANRLVHAVLWLGITLATTAVLFVQLEAPFIAAIQLMLYVGGVMTLMIFGVMLTRRAGDGELRTPGSSPLRGAATALALFALLVRGIMASSLSGILPQATGDTAGLGRTILSDHILSFEVLSVLLLAAMIGAIVIARRRDPGAEQTDSTRGLP